SHRARPPWRPKTRCSIDKRWPRRRAYPGAMAWRARSTGRFALHREYWQTAYGNWLVPDGLRSFLGPGHVLISYGSSVSGGWFFAALQVLLNFFWRHAVQSFLKRHALQSLLIRKVLEMLLCIVPAKILHCIRHGQTLSFVAFEKLTKQRARVRRALFVVLRTVTHLFRRGAQ